MLDMIGVAIATTFAVISVAELVAIGYVVYRYKRF